MLHRFSSPTAAACRWLACCCLATLPALSVAGNDDATSPPEGAAQRYLVGVATVDITPEFPVRLSGYAVRTTEHEGVEDPIFARAMAVSENADTPPAILLTVDTCILSTAIRDEIARRIESEHHVPQSRVTLNVSHSHTTPMLEGTIPNMFGMDIPPDHAERISRYTRSLIDRCVSVAGEAVEHRVACTLAWGTGRVGFAANRRTKGGPTDHAVPVLCARRDDGTVHAIVANYACHCTTLGGAFNQVSPDWAGYAAKALEARHPKAVALITIGCGADQNPAPRPGIDNSRAHGLALADAVLRVLNAKMLPLDGPIIVDERRVSLRLDVPEGKQHWQNLAEQQNAIGRHARLQLERLESGKPLESQVDLPIQTWRWGDRLAMVFIAGEVVVDYALRLQTDLDGERLWVSGYTNGVPCYIPSERVLKEGGYEAAGAMTYYGLPGPFQSRLEQKIIAAVTQQLGVTYAKPLETPPAETLNEAAKQILDDSTSNETRTDLIEQHAASSASLLERMVSDLEPGTDAEQRRIPPIWRVTVAAGRRNDLAELAQILDVALPRENESLREWQAVVIGGGIINGIGLVGDRPGVRLERVLQQRPQLRSRWQSALELSVAMADNEVIKPGTRYDALRMIALLDWSTACPVLTRYLASENRELRQGAVSGLADLPDRNAWELLLNSLDQLDEKNRDFALDGLIRDSEAKRWTLEALQLKALTLDQLGEARVKQLREDDAADVRAMAAELEVSQTE